jgi:peptide/nickel transport system substrate-binding protein/oligopeptide transport system substrate-binding protein
VLRRRWRGVATTAVAVSLLAGAACSNDEPPKASVGTDAPVVTAAPTGGGTLRLGVTRFDSLDPADVVPTIQSDMIAIDLLFESLTSIDPATNEAVPAVAAEVKHDDSLTKWTFTLRDDATFSDGSPVTAADVKLTLERVVSKEASLAGAPLEIIAGYADFREGKTPDLAGVVATNDETVDITTTVPYAPLPELLASPVYGIVSKDAVDELKSEFGQKPVGSGLFAFVSQDDTSVVLKRAGGAGSGGAGGSGGAKAKLDGVTLLKFADRAEALQALRDGKVDWAGVPTGQTIEDADKVGVVQPGLQSAEFFFGINTANPKFANPKFRQAIVKAIDRRKIATEAQHSTMPLDGVVPPKQPGGSNDACGEPCAFDVEGATQLLAEVFPDGNIPPVELDFQTGETSEDKAQQKAAEQIQAALTAVGITVQPAPKPFEEYRSFPHSGNGEIFSYGWVGLSPDPEAYLAPLFLATSGNNVTAFKDEAVDKAIAAARATPDRQARLAAYQAIEKQIMAQAPIVPIAVIDFSVIVSPKVAGYAARFDGTFAVDQLALTP